MNPWGTLLVAGVFEVAWAFGLKYSGFWPRVLTILAMVVSFTLLAQAMKSLPLGTAYAVWTGIGTIGTMAIGVALLDEPATLLRFGCVTLILVGMVGLKLTATAA